MAFVIKYWKYLLSLVALVGILFKILKKRQIDEPKDLNQLTPNERRGYKSALQIRSALNVKTGFWGWTENEEAVIEVLNQNKDIFHLITKYYTELTKNSLLDDISKYLSSDDISKIEIEVIRNEVN